jgi:hypothetical protein
MSMPTLLDIAKHNGSDAVVGLVEEAIRAVPELSGSVMYRGKTVTVPNMGAARTIKGQQYRTLIRTALPSVGFRNANQGVAASKSTYENKLVETFILNPRWECDKAVADVHEDGPEAFIALEGIGMTGAAMMALGKQFYYGRLNGGDAKGHPGIIDSVDASMVVDATGSTPDTGSSVWLVKFGPQAVQWVFGENGSLEMKDPREESITDDEGNRYTAYVQELLAYAGVQVLDKFSVARIKNLTAQTGKGLTDSLLGDALALFPVGKGPDVILGSRRSLEQLRKSRTATNATGSEAPTPTEFEGVPIVATDSILNTEAIG